MADEKDVEVNKREKNIMGSRLKGQREWERAYNNNPKIRRLSEE